MSQQSIVVESSEKLLHITLNAVASKNAIDDAMLSELHAALDRAANDPHCRVVVLRANGENFCTGLDIRAVAADVAAPQDAAAGSARFSALMSRIISMPKIVVALVDGKVSAGGVGIVAACDVVLSSRRSQFSLPEALWGLLPCMVLPVLARRTGLQAARLMMLTTQVVDATEAHRRHLVDELADDLERAAKKHVNRISNLQPATISSMKQFVNHIWPLGQEQQEYALQETTRLLSSPTVIGNIKTFVESGIFPWER